MVSPGLASSVTIPTRLFSCCLFLRARSADIFPTGSSSLCGVSQGLVLGPIPFSLYILPLGHLFSRFQDVSYHYYADDTLIYFTAKPNNLNQLSSFHDCLAATKYWMSLKLLHLLTKQKYHYNWT
ncbi:hypothetical protein N1851_027770 [Merluccius polli]|uniref:Reverse transcriptase domain-containing protein n=1 Tax=Merluccius polli TaxID=89951 RepID=A0AA47NU63_MERPO|nr:hypothetical protein N1851_027770 [Merluccius polli]